MKWRPSDPPLNELAEKDLQALLVPRKEDRIREGFFVEYKRDWTNKGIVRAVAAFANTHGGTLLIGIEADKLFPVDIPGIPGHPGDLEERAVQVIRSSVAPMPDFVPRAIQPSNGNVCLVVEVTEGRLPPYLMLANGVILERTPAQSDPVPIHNRDTLDRLFLRGERGRTWARRLAEASLNVTNSMVPPLKGAQVLTVPCVDGGLGANPLIFRRSFVLRVRQRSLGYWGLQDRTQEVPILTGSYVEYTTPPYNQVTYSLRVETTGEITTTLSAPRMQTAEMETFIAAALTNHADLTESELGWRGDVAIGLFVQSGDRRAYVLPTSVSMATVRSAAFHELLKRDALRSMGIAVNEDAQQEGPRDAS